MHIVKFDHSYIPEINSWLVAREHKVPPLDDFPKIGYVVSYRGEYVACAFIREVEGNYGQLDGLATNPDFPGDMRSEAIDLVVQKIFTKAKEMKLKALLSFSKDKNTLIRSKKFGFKEVPETVIVAELS